MTLLLCTASGFILSSYSPLHRVDIAMVYLLGVVLVSLRVKSRLALVMPLLSVGTFILFFVPPGLSTSSGKTGYLVTLLVMFAVAVMINSLVERLRRQEAKANDSALALEIEQLRSTLLSSVSHDLRAPLASIAGAASSLLTVELSLETRADLARSVYEQAQRLNRLLKNLLDITKLESGAITPNYDWHNVEELVGVALNQFESELADFCVAIKIADDMPLFWLDDVLIEQLLVNLLDNCVKYSQTGQTINIDIRNDAGRLLIEFQNPTDNAGEDIRSKLFDKFYRGPKHAHIIGSGLGLTICKAIVLLHKGSIMASHSDGKITFVTSLPVAQRVVSLPNDEILE